MKERKKLYVIIVVSLVAFFVLFNYFNKKEEIIKITNIRDIPAFVLDELKQIDVKKGVYLFTGDDIYIVVCSNMSSDISVGSFSSKLKWVGTDRNKFLDKISYDISFKNSGGKSMQVGEFSLPIVVFRVVQQTQANINDFKIALDGETLKLNEWIGKDALSDQEQNFNYEIIKDLYNTPKEIRDSIDKLSFKSTKGFKMYVFTKPYFSQGDEELFGCIEPEGSFYDGFEQYVLIQAPDSYSSGFKLLFEHVNMGKYDFYGEYKMFLRAVKNDGLYSYCKNKLKPFVVIKISDKVGGPDPKYMIPNMLIINDKYEILKLPIERKYVVTE